MSNQYEIREYSYYCPKCGQCHFITCGSNEICLVCGCCMLETPHEYYLTEEKMQDNYEEFEQNEQRLFNEVISKSPEFDINLYNNRDLILKQKQKQQEESIAYGKAILEEKSRQVKCTYCHSTNVKKISLLNRVVSTGVWGLSSKKIGKQFHCNNCGADF